MISKRHILSLLALLFVFSGCTSQNANTVARRDFLGDIANMDSSGAELSVGDTLELSVEVDGAMEVSRHRSEINYQGMVTLPLVGDVKISRLKLDEARLAISRAYGAYYVNPPVVMLSTVDDADAGEWGFVTITGRVREPGIIPIPTADGIKLTAVIQEAGGFTASAKRSGIRVSRVDSSGKKLQVVVNYDEIGQEGNAEADILLVDGDIIYVPERIF